MPNIAAAAAAFYLLLRLVESQHYCYSLLLTSNFSTLPLSLPGFPRYDKERYRFNRDNLFFVGKQIDAQHIEDLGSVVNRGEHAEFIAS